MKQPMMGFSRKVIPPPPAKTRPGFKFNQLASPVPQQSLGPQVPPEMNFVDRYNQLLEDRPDRLAYREHALEGPPNIERGKWAKLGAILAGGLTGFGSNDAGAGMNLGLGAYYEPERKARESWEMQRANLGELAGMEDTDIQGRLGALEMENRNYWAGRSENRADEALAETKRSNIVGEGQTNRQINLQGLMPIENPTDGMTYLYNKETREMTPVGKTGLTTEEQLVARAKEITQELTLKEPYEVKADNRRAGQAMAVAKIGAGSRENVAEIQANARREAQRMKLAQGANSENQITRAISTDLLASTANPQSNLYGVNLDDYIEIGENDIPRVRTAGGFLSSKPDPMVVAEIRRIIDTAIGRGRTPVAPGTAPAVNVGDTMQQPGSGWGAPIVR